MGSQMNDQDIQNLIESPKRILKKSPASGFNTVNGYKRCSVEVVFDSDDDIVAWQGAKFEVFIRQNVNFEDNFSVGLLFKPGISALPKDLPLVRCNGSHGEESRDEDGHFSHPHIHRITASEITSGSIRPEPRNRQITEKYSSLEEAIWFFFEYIGVKNFNKFFPDLHVKQMRLFS